MAKKIKIYACQNGHKIVSDAKNEKRFTAGKILCGSCNNVFAEYKSPSWSSFKHFLCQVGHVITITPFGDGQCNLSWGDGNNEFININHTPEQMSELLKTQMIKCPAGTTPCNTTLSALEDYTLSVSQLLVAKTRTRVGDIWDKHKYPEPKSGSYDKDYNFQHTEFSKLNRERMKTLRKKRNTRPAGEIIDRPTKRNYKDGSRRPTKEDL